MSTYQRDQYFRFHEVVLFDTTFKTNALGMALATFVGVDHNNRNVVLAMGLLSDESAISFEWLFTKVLEATNMHGPLVIYTDQDPAISKAIASKLPGAKHRLCSWHLVKNLKENLKNLLQKEQLNAIVDVFWRLVKEDFTEAEVERLLSLMRDHCQRNESALDVIGRLDAIKEKWIKFYSNELFTMDISSTSRAESVNSLTKAFSTASKTATLIDLMQSLKLIMGDKHIVKSRVEDLKDKLGRSRFGSFTISHFSDTMKAFLDKLSAFSLSTFEEQCEKAARMNCHIMLLDNPPSVKLSVRGADGSSDNRASYCVSLVSKDDATPTGCSCPFPKNWGLPCCHILKVCMQLQTRHVSINLFSERWLRNSSMQLPLLAARHLVAPGPSSLLLSSTDNNNNPSSFSSTAASVGSMVHRARFMIHAAHDKPLLLALMTAHLDEWQKHVVPDSTIPRLSKPSSVPSDTSIHLALGVSQPAGLFSQLGDPKLVTTNRSGKKSKKNTTTAGNKRPRK